LISYILCKRRYRDLDKTSKAKVIAWAKNYLNERVTIPESASDNKISYPPFKEIKSLWDKSQEVNDDESTVAFLLINYGIDAKIVAQKNLARVCLTEIDKGIYPWAGYVNNNNAWRSWPAEGRKLVVPLFDATGAMRSIIFRRVGGVSSKNTLKSVGPTGFARRGLVMADDIGRFVLNKGSFPQGWPPVGNPRVVITEGETDFLKAATSVSTSYAYMTFGIISGSWTSDIANKIPDGSIVVIATDDDEQGDEYANVIRLSLEDRHTTGLIRLERWRP
jgi:hypothetical protein